MKRIESAELSNIIVKGISFSDYPDFCDAYVESCDVDGVEATEEQLDYINEKMPWVAQEKAYEKFC